MGVAGLWWAQAMTSILMCSGISRYRCTARGFWRSWRRTSGTMEENTSTNACRLSPNLRCRDGSQTRGKAGPVEWDSTACWCSALVHTWCRVVLVATLAPTTSGQPWTRCSERLTQKERDSGLVCTYGILRSDVINPIRLSLLSACSNARVREAPLCLVLRLFPCRTPRAAYSSPAIPVSTNSLRRGDVLLWSWALFCTVPSVELCCIPTCFGPALAPPTNAAVLQASKPLSSYRCGSASHLGVLEDLPTVGVAKNLLHLPGLDEARVRARVAEYLDSIKKGLKVQKPRGGTAVWWLVLLMRRFGRWCYLDGVVLADAILTEVRWLPRCGVSAGAVQ